MKQSKMVQTSNSQAAYQKASNEAVRDKQQVESARRTANNKKYGKGI